MSKDDSDKYKTLVSNLENELKSKGENNWQIVTAYFSYFVTRHLIIYFSENKNSMLEAEIRSLQRRLVRRDNEILKQERELHKLRVREMEREMKRSDKVTVWSLMLPLACSISLYYFIKWILSVVGQFIPYTLNIQI